MTTDHKALYEAAVVLVEAKRCATCEHYNATKDGAGCAEYQTDIPAEYIYQPNECERYLIQIPF
jgi:hypothetical protein